MTDDVVNLFRRDTALLLHLIDLGSKYTHRKAEYLPAIHPEIAVFHDSCRIRFRNLKRVFGYNPFSPVLHDRNLVSSDGMRIEGTAVSLRCSVAEKSFLRRAAHNRRSRSVAKQHTHGSLREIQHLGELFSSDHQRVLPR